MLPLLMLAGLFAPATDASATVVHVDRIDVNHIYRPDGSIVLDQLIFWRWSVSDRRFHAVGWILLRDGRTTDDAAHHAAWKRMIRKAHGSKFDNSWPSYKGKWIGCKEVPVWDGRHWVSRIVKGTKVYIVKADWVQPHHSTNDPEADDRRDFPNFPRDIWK